MKTFDGARSPPPAAEQTTSDGPVMTSERRLFLAFALSVGLVTGVAVASFVTVARFREDAHRVVDSQQLVGALLEVIALTTDAETAARGYTITGDEAYLQPYEDAVQRVDSDLAQIVRLAGTEPSQLERSGQLSTLVAQRLELVRSLIAVRRHEGVDAARAFVVRGEGKKVQDVIRRVAGELTTAAKVALTQRLDESAQSAQYAAAAAASGTLFSIGLAGFALYSVRRDFAGSRRAHAALTATNARLNAASLYARSLLEASHDPLFAVLADGRVSDVNTATESITGVSREQLIGSDFSRYFSDTEGADRCYRAAFAEGSVIDAVLAIHHTSGARTAVLLNASVYRNPRDDVAGVVVALHDITERQRARQALQIAATAFEAQEALIVTDAAGVILQVNRAFTEMTGYTDQDAVGQTPRLLKSGQHDAHFYTAMWQDLLRDDQWRGEVWNRRKSGDVYLESLSISAVKDQKGVTTHFVGALTDITLRRAAEDAVKQLAFYDPLTQLPNRRLLLDRLQQTLVASARHQRSGALLFIDLDNFKTLNDTLGHDMGDLLLQQVAGELTSCIRKSDTVARFGGDEFVVMLEGLSANRHHAAMQVRRVGDKIHTRFNAPFVIAGHEYVGTASIGVTLFGARQDTVEELLKQTDLAMYQAKAAGRNTLRFFDPGMQTALEARAVLEAELRVALRESQFLLFYQPQVDREGRMTGVEALVRWQHPERGLVLPDTFIDLAEETGLIRPMGLWVLDTACRQLATWATRPETAGLRVAVNVSAREFGEPDFADQVVRALERAGAEPRRLTLELTESLLLADLPAAIGKITALKAQGVGFSLDDFGTGYSSLSSLKQLPLDQLKIDQSFIKDLGTDPNDAAIVRAILALGRTLGLAVIAEGVETTAQRDLLAADGCQAFQGYLFGRPDSAAALRIETRADA